MFQHSSHPKVAANQNNQIWLTTKVSTQQPPEGGCQHLCGAGVIFVDVSTQQPPEGGCKLPYDTAKSLIVSTQQPPEGGCSLHKKARKISKLNTVFR